MRKKFSSFTFSPFISSFIVITFLLTFVVSFPVFSQALDVTTCATIVKRSNGNGQSGLAAGNFSPLSTQNNPVAPNVLGTSYQLVPFLPSAKTGDVHFKWTSSTGVSNVPVITRVWLTASGSTSGTLSNIKFGPPSAVTPSAPNYYVDYAFYNNNMPAQGFITLEFTDPQTGIPVSRCSYDLNSNGSATNPTIDCTPTIITQPANQSICGATSASFSVSASGATAYQWQVSTNGGSTYTNLSTVGNYYGTTSSTLNINSPNSYNNNLYRVVLPSTGCSGATSTAALLVSNPKPTAVLSGAASLCGVGTRSLGITFTGTPPYSITYNTTPASGTASSTTVNNITTSPYYISVSPSATTTYSITSVSDAYCSNSSPAGSVSATVNAPPTVTPSNATVCIGSNSFSLPFTATGNPNKYSITAGTRAMTGFSAITNATLSGTPLSVTIPTSGVSAGTYDFNIVVTNTATGCVSASVPFTLTVNALPVLSASASSTSVCASTSVTLTAAPAGLSSYSWTSSPASTISSVYNPTVNPTATTTYTVNGTNSNGCIATANVTVSIVAAPVLSISPAAPTVCSGTATLLTASGGTSYSWSPSTGLSATTGTSVVVTPTATTTYTVTSQNSSGCASTGTVTVTVSTPSIAIASSNATICSGNSSTLTASGGSTYSWTPVTGLYTDAAATVAYTGTSLATVYAKPTATTTYYVQGATASGCTGVGSTTVTVSTAPVNASNSVSHNYTFCSTGTSTFQLSVNVTSSVTSMTWSYSTTQVGPYTSFTSAASTTGATLTPSSTGSLNSTLTISGYSNGGYAGPRYLRLVIVSSICTYNYDIQLYDTKGSGASLPSPTAAKTSICSGDNTVLSIGDLNSGLTVQWQSSTSSAGTYSNITGATSTSYTTPALTANTYYKAVISGQGSCGYTTGAVAITVASAISGNTVTPSTTCSDGSAAISLTGTAITGGSYQWQSSITSAANGFSDIVGATSQNYTSTQTIVGQTTWYRRVASVGNCSSNTSAVVVIYAPITNNQLTNSATSFCGTATATTLSATTPVGADGAYNYQWQSTTDGTTFANISGATAASYTTISQTQTYYYKRVVSSTASGCTSTSNSFVITVNAIPSITINTGSTSLCSGTSTTLTGNGGVSYTWSPNTAISSTTGTFVTVNPTSTQTYTVTGVSAAGCSATASTTITVTTSPSAPTVSASTQTICNNADAFNLNSMITSGTATYEWYIAPVVASAYLISSPSAVTIAGTYYAFTKNGSCYSSGNASVALSVADVSAPVVSNTSLAVCSPATVDLTSVQPVAASGTTLEWHTGNTSGSSIVSTPSSVGTGTYYLFAKSTVAGCYGSPSSAVTVTINTIPVTSVGAAPGSLCAPSTVNLNTYNTTANNTYTYQWYTVANNPTPAALVSISSSVSQTGIYYLYAISSASCKGSASSPLLITINGKPTAGISSPAPVCAATAISITTSTDASTPSYTWQSSANSGTSYSTLANGGVYSGTGIGTLAISSSTGLDGYNYRYTVTSSTGCSSTSDNAILAVEAAGSITTNPTDITVGVNSNATFNIATGGSPTLNYQWKVSTDGGTTYNTISDGSLYFGTTSPELVITSAQSALNGYKYECQISNDCTPAITSASGSLFINSCTTPTVGGSVSGSATVCSGTNSTVLTLGGNTGSVIRWESSTDNFTTITTIANVTTTYTATNLTASTQYRAVVQSGSCASANSAAATVAVNTASVGGSVSGSATVCSGTNSTVLTLGGNTGSVIRWESSTDNFTTITTIANVTTTYTATNLTATTQYRAVVQSGSCGAVTSSSATITILTGQWIGGSSGDWSNPANWCGGVPTLSTDVSIPANSVVQIKSDIGVAKSVVIASGATIVMTGSFKLRIADGGTFENNGTFDASGSTGSVSFLGSGTITGNTTFNNVETFGALDFGTSSTVTGIFTLQPGGSVTGHSPTYTCPGSSLVYNTGGVFARGLEWASVTSGPGYPSNVTIQSSTTIDFPIEGPGYVCNDLTVQSGSSLYQTYSGASAPLTVGRNVTISGILSLGSNTNDNITLGGNWTRNAGAIFNSNSRSVTFNGTAASVITAPASSSRDVNGAFGGETFYDVNINKTTSTNTVSLASNISITNELKISKGIFDLAAGDVTIVSNSASTAHVASVPSSGATITYSGAGRFIAQRNLNIGTGSVSRRWRLLTAPLQPAGAPSINAAWQEGVSNADRTNPIDPWPGFGTTITKSTTYNAANGYDQGSTENPSVYYLSSGTWTPPSSTLSGAITDKEGYMLFARGNRSIVVSTPTINASPTTLEPKGRINVGDVQKTIGSGYQVIGNPYASAISMNNVVFNSYTSGSSTFNNSRPGSVAGITYYIWDPKTSGSSQVGKFIACSSNGDGTYSVTGNSSGLPTDGTVQSGTAFLLSSGNSGGTITFHETDKIATSSTTGISSRVTGSAEASKLITNLYAGAVPSQHLADGVINIFGAAYADKAGSQDVVKLSSFNSSEVLSIASAGKQLAIEKRNAVSDKDTVFLTLSAMKQATYGLQFIASDFDPSVTAFVEDKFTGVSKAINVSDTTYVPFTIGADVASSAADRFRIVFKTGRALALITMNVEAFEQDKAIVVKWKTASEVNIKEYAVEKSTDGRNFEKASTAVAKGEGQASATYNWTDNQPQAGNNFYRIKSISSNGSFGYSKIVKVTKASVQPAITVYPNPATEGKLHLKFTNQAAGVYNIKIVNSLGQVGQTKTLTHAQGSATETVTLNSALLNGTYDLQILTPAKETKTVKVIVLKK